MEERSYEVFGRSLVGEDGRDVVEIHVDFYNIPKEKKNQIESAAQRFLDLTKEIMEES